mmetsp:Transcript_44141/g.87591  ORF Transcript_44141/g.87591 Transcript_44141/m.87591 type:complete len:203 (+) Transcript_44141:74-682(+)
MARGIIALLVASCSLRGEAVNLNRAAQGSSVWNAEFTVQLLNGTGSFTVEVHPDWAPRGAARFQKLLQQGVLSDARFFRVVPNFMVQFGIPGNPEVAARWHDANLDDDDVKQSNSRGYMTYATAGPNTRTTQMFINFKNNNFLDGQGFAPFAKVTKGMDVVDAINAEYREAPSQGMIQAQGNPYLEKNFPRLSFIKSAVVKA